MNSPHSTLTAWVYDGVWRILTDWFKVPQTPPTLPLAPGDTLESFKPADNFLQYLKFYFWIAIVILDLVILIPWLLILLFAPVMGIILAPLFLIALIVPDVMGYIAIHLRYDTTWYVMTNRSIRIRRGIWVIRETTITFDNVQNITVSQGPLQRWFGISDILIDTAGGGGAVNEDQQPGHALGAHRGLVEGIDNPQEIRDRLLSRMKSSLKAGLGDDDFPAATTTSDWTFHHLDLLKEIRDQILMMTKRG